MSLRAARLHVDANLLIEPLKIIYTLYSPRVTRSRIIQMQLQTENIDPINNNMVRLNNTEYYQVVPLNTSLYRVVCLKNRENLSKDSFNNSLDLKLMRKENHRFVTSAATNNEGSFRGERSQMEPFIKHIRTC